MNMTESINYAFGAVVLFFAGSWTFWLLVSPHMRLTNRIVSVTYWWIAIGFALASAFSVWHLLWLMPLALIVPILYTQAQSASARRTDASAIFVKSAFVVAPAIGALVFWP
jgi:hypothetical protein